MKFVKSVTAILAAFAFTPAATFAESGYEHNSNSEIVDWSGAYVGLTLGRFKGDSFFCDTAETCDGNPDDISPLPTQDPFGDAYGLNAGYNWQRGRVVYGVEIGFSKIFAEDGGVSTVHATNPDYDYDCGDLTGAGVMECVTSIDRALSLRGRIGRTHGDWLPFLTAGIALIDAQAGFPDYDPNTNGSDLITVPVAGIGVEYRLNERLSIKGEALRYFDGGDVVYANTTECVERCGAAEIQGTQWQIGLNFHF